MEHSGQHLNIRNERAAEMDLDHKNAYIAGKISLTDYLYAQASNIRFIPYLDEEDVALSELSDGLIAEAGVSLESFNLESQDGFTNFSDEEDDDDDDFDDDPYFEDPDLFNPHRKTESLYTSQSSIIAMATDIESLLQPSIIVAEVITNLCLECSTQLIVGSFIVCSNCHKNVHYLWNKPTVTSYYKKNTKNFNVIFVNQPKNRYFIINQ